VSKPLEHIYNLPMITSYEDASAKVANSEVLRDMRDESNYVKTTMKAGANCQETCFMPLVLSRQLGHSELIFSQASDAGNFFEREAASKWVLNDSNECWICDSWKYTVIFFNRKMCN
jgi:hypothetical protein